MSSLVANSGKAPTKSPVVAAVATTPAPTPTNAPTSTPTNAPATVSNAAAAGSSGYRLPENMTLQSAAKWAIIEDKPIMMDYWADSLEKKVVVGVKDNQEKLLVKSADEYTSPIAKIFKNKTDLIIMTENSIYLVDAAVDVVKIT